MIYKTLGNSDLKISSICLGSMTWGEQNTEAEGHEQLDYAVAQGINFIDTAEMYPVFPKSETYGLTEKCLGSWLHKRQCRDKVIIATKVVGPGLNGAHIRGGSRFDRKNIQFAIEGSLKRLQTDYIDLYQLHWPDRNVNIFGKLNYQHDENEKATPLLETLSALAELVQAGKVRYIGVSNETPWGVMTLLKLAEQHNLPRIVSIQNPYNLLNRSYELNLAEISHRERISLLAYSPLAFGVLTGKYLNGQQPSGARLTLFPQFERYAKSEQGTKAIEAYVNLAQKYGLAPAQMALAYVNTRPFMTSNIIGATTMAQLKSNIDSLHTVLSDEILAELEAIHTQYIFPCP